MAIKKILVRGVPKNASEEAIRVAVAKRYSARIIEFEWVVGLTVEQAFELSDVSSERSAAGDLNYRVLGI